MPKRKRSAETSLLAAVEQHQVEISRALKAAKGFERQRQSKRLRQDRLPADKRQRIEREIDVLKSLDLHQTARAHLISSLLRIEPVATSPDLPNELRDAISKPQVSEAERTALHNVTSSLYNRDSVRQATEHAISAVCRALNISVPDRTKRARTNNRTRGEDLPPDRASLPSASANSASAGAQAASDDESEFQGFETDLDEPGSVLGEHEGETDVSEEKYLSKYDHLLGSSSDDEGDGFDARAERLRGKEAVNLDDISLSGTPSEDEAGDSSESEPDTAPPPPAEHKQKGVKQTVATARTDVVQGSAFLPSLMSGYISGSESASDVEEAKPRKRRGQRARQAIWEKKYGQNAKHFQKENQSGGRDAGWDMRRGAVDGDGRKRKAPWIKGASDPSRNEALPKPTPRPTKRDDQGPLHPSWAAKKKAQEAQKSMSFTGQKITFE